MFKIGRLIFFRDEEFKPHLGKIIGTIEEDQFSVWLKVKSIKDQKEYCVKQVKFSSEKEADKFYLLNGHY